MTALCTCTLACIPSAGRECRESASCQARPLPGCVNCGGPLGLSTLYCDDCVQRDGEAWYPWRDRLAIARVATAITTRRFQVL